MYEQHYGLTLKPFQLSPDPRFFYASNKHKQALSYLEYGLEQGEGFIVITGPVGTGKTTLAQSLLSNLDASKIHAVQIVTSKLSPEDLLLVITKEFGLTPISPAKAHLLQAIEEHLMTLKLQGMRALLLVDEAQNLPLDSVEELRMLSNFQSDSKPLLQSFLLGQEELKGIILSPELEQFRQRIIASCHLQPLTVKEIEQYVVHRLTSAEIENAEIFDQECFIQIQQITKGVPRKINLLVDRILLYGFLNDLTHFTSNEVQIVIDEMADELSASLSEHNQQHESVKTQVSHNLNPTNNHDALYSSLQKVDDYLQENIDQKIKMNRYLDKLLKQKNLTLSQFDSSKDDN
ncbi:XrtA-associated ATPase [Thalassotalea psychrophila]|uniref:XrtA-associated ATPase n=1 Tax=Thalassotalea psychrophila TaxID=3065647 RepID=A0ABY9TUL4_9GAMM|nr:XrtA-associated ATPase [Colwelliaceae bacterium SQ149]